MPAWRNLKQSELVDTTRIAAIGYCFGGTTVIELARSGADIAGIGQFPRRTGFAHARGW